MAGLRPAGLLLALVMILPAGCEPPPEPLEVAEIRERFDLPRRVGVHFVRLSGRGATEVVEPAALEILEGDVVVFQVDDHRVHTLEFLPEDSDPAPWRFLEETGQGWVPPLLSLGSRFVVSFREAPDGVLAFRSQGGGGEARGVIRLLSAARR